MAIRILVTGSSTFFATRLIHDLGRRGVEVTAADSLAVSPGKASRFVSRRLLVPSPGTNPGGFLEAIQTELASRRYDLLLPAFEESVLLSEYRTELQKHTKLFLPLFASMQQLHHKPSLSALCRKLGLPTPPTVVPRNLDDLALAAQALRYPIVLKLPMGNNSVGRAFCDDWDSLHANYSQLAATQQQNGDERPFLQQKIDGELVYTLCFANEGRKLGEVLYRTRRTFPEAGGTSAHRESIDHPQISRIANQLLAATDWTGFLGLDFIVERETGIPYLIDANPRPNPAIHLGFLAGVDWSRILLDLAAGINPQPQMARAGVHVHTLMLDIGWLCEGLSPLKDVLWKFPGRFAKFLSPPWPVNSRDDLLTIGETAAAFVILLHSGYSFAKALLLGRPFGQVLLANANYDAVAAHAYRLQRLQSGLRPAVAAESRVADAA